MKEPRLEPDSPAHGVISYDARIAADTDVSASSYASTVSSVPVESLEVHTEAPKVRAATPMTDSRFKAPFSRRKAAVVSAIITGLVVILTGGSLVVLNRETKQPDSSSRLNLSSQDIQLKNQSGATSPAELQGVGNAVLVNGDLITRGQLKVTSGAYLTLLRPANLTSNRSLTLPDASGVLCVDSNNCGYATTAQLQQLQSQLGQIVVPEIPAATTVNGQGGAVSIQGASNQVSVTTANGVIALSTPQDLAPISSPTFANLLLNGNFSVSGTVTLPLNCSGMLNGGTLTTNASGQVICSGDDGGAGGTGNVSTVGGTAGNLALFTAADTIADSIISQVLGVITIDGNTTVSGSLSANSLTLATALSVADGGTGATTFTTNGVLIGNGTGAVNSTTAPLAGQVLLGDASAVPQFTTVSGDVVITGAGVTTIQANSVALGVDTTGNYVANLGALTGLATSGNTGEGSTPTLSVVYGSGPNTAVQGNTSISVTAGTNLTGGGSITLGGGGTVTLNVTNSPTFGGNVIAQGGTVTMGTTSISGFAVLNDGNGQIGTLAMADLTTGRTYTFPDATGVVCLNTGNCVGGSGGAPNAATYLTIGNNGTLTNERSITAGTNIAFTDGGANGTFTISTVNNPDFSTRVSTPLLQSSGALSITPGGDLTVGATGQTALLQGSTTTITSNGAGNDIVLTSADQITLTGFNCTTFANGGVLTTDASGNIVCANDDGGAGGAITGTGTANRMALFTGSQSVADSWLLQNGSTLELDNTRNLSLLGGNFSVTGTGTFSGLLTANGSLTIESGDTFTMNGDAFTDLTGTGLVISSGSLQTTLGTSVDLTAEVNGILPVTNGGTGVNGSTASNGQLLIGNGTGYTLATLTQGDGITITNASGGITVASAFGTSIDLGVETTGNYQAGTTAGSGIAVSGTPSGGWSPTIALGALTANWDQTGAFDIVLNNANSELRVLESTGGTYFGTIDVGDLTDDRTYTFPDADGTICLSTGNCAGAGGGITGSGTSDTIAKFTGAGTIGDSSISDNGSVVTLNGTATLVIQGGTATFGTATQAGSLTISDGSSNTVSIVMSAFGANRQYTIPDVGADASFCLSTGNCVGGGSGGAPNAAAYLVASLDGTLTSERALAAGSNISLTDGGANGSFTVATVQDPTFTVSVTTPELQSSGALALISATGEVIAVDAGTTIELQDSTNVTGSLDVSVALNVGTSNAFQVNSSGAIAAATGITSSGTVTFSALNCTTFTNGGKLTTNASGQLTCANDNGAAAGTITGSGTGGTLPIFTATNVIADSIVSQSGTTVNIAGDLTLDTALAVAEGGTGVTSFTANGILYGNATGALQVTDAGISGQVLVADASGVPTFVSFSGDVTIAANGATTIQPDSVALGTDTTGSYVANLGTLTGLSTTGNSGEGSTPTLSVNYGSTANTAVQGNTQLTCPSGTGNLSGGGMVITLGTGGTCAALDTVADPTFSTSVATPILQSTGDMTITPGGALTIGVATQSFTLQGNATSTITATGGGHTTTVGFTGTPTGAVTYQFDRAAAPGTYTICTSVGNCSGAAVTLQSAYTNSTGGTTPEILLDSTRGALTVRDNASPLATNLFEVQNNTGTTTYLGVSAVGASITGNLNIAGTGGASSVALTVRGNGAQGGGDLLTEFLSYDGVTTKSILRLTNDAGLFIGNNTDTAGRFGISNGTEYGILQTTNLTATHIYELPNVGGTICVDAGNCGSVTGTLQAAYNYSTGGSTPEIKLNNPQTSIDLQDADTTLGANANFMSFRGSNASGLGSLLVGFGIQGNLYMRPSDDRTDFWDINDAGGNNLFTLNSTNKRVGINLGGTNLPSYTLDIAGTANISTSLLVPAIDRATAGTLSVATSTATAVTIGRAGVMTTVDGGLTVAANQNIVMSTGSGQLQFDTDGEVYIREKGSTDDDHMELFARAGYEFWTNTGQNVFSVSQDGKATVMAGVNNNQGGLEVLQSDTNPVLTVSTAGTEGSIKVGYGSDGQATPFILDNDATSDPTGIKGAMYYNNSTNKFRCYQNASWVDCISPTGASTTLQQAYDFSTGGATAEIVLDSTRGALTVQDNASPISGNLLEVKSSNGISTYLGLTSAALTLGSNIDLIMQGDTAYISNPQGGTQTEAFGLNAAVSVGSQYALAVGYDAFAETRSIAIGWSASAADSSVALGSDATSSASGSIAIGANTDTGSNASSIAIGADAVTTAANQMVIGSNGHPINTMVVGKGVTNGAPTSFTLQGTSGSGSNIAGAAVNIAGGQGTGSAAGGAINLRVSAAGSAGSTLNGLATVATFGSSSVTIGNTTNTTAITLQSAGTTLVTSTATGLPTMKIQQAANSTTGGRGLLIVGGANPGEKVFEIVNNSTDNTPIFSVDSSNSRTTIGSGASCTGRLCVGQTSTGVGGGGTTTNLYNIQNVTLSSGTGTYVGQNIVINDTSSALANTIRPLVLDTTGSTNTSATVNSIQAMIRSGATGTFLQFQNGSTDVLNVNNTGATTFRTTVASANAFQIQNAVGGTVFNLDTTTASANLVTNPSFETNTTGWTARTGTTNMVRTTTHPLFGAAGMSFDTDASNEGVNYPIQLSAGTYTISFYSKNLNSDTASFWVGYAADGATETNTPPSGFLSSGLSSSIDGWNKHALTFTLSGTANAGAYLFIKTTSLTARTFVIDGVQITAGQYAGAYRESSLSLHGTVINTPLQVQTANNSETALSIMSSEGIEVLNVSTTKKTVSINTSSADARFNVNSNTNIDAIKITNSGSGDSLEMSSTGAGHFLRLHDATAGGVGVMDVFTVADEGATTVRTRTNMASAFQVQDAAAASLFTVDTTARSASGGNLVKIGNSTGTDGDVTILKLDSTTTAGTPSSNLSALNGGLFYNSDTNKVMIIENGVVKELCNKVDMGCGAGATTPLQTAYNDSTGGTTSEIILDNTRGALDIQDRSAANGGSILGNLFNIRGSAANNSTAGALLFGVGYDGAVTIQSDAGSVAGSNGPDALTVTADNGNDDNGGSGGHGGSITLQAGNGGYGIGTGGDGGNITLRPGAAGNGDFGDGLMGAVIIRPQADGEVFWVANSTNSLIQLSVDTNETQVRIGNAAADAETIELVVDASNATTETTASNGAIYYNTGGRGGASGLSAYAGKFRCREGLVWKNCIGMRDIVERRWGYAVAQGIGSTTFSADGFFTSTMLGAGVDGSSAAADAQTESNYIKFTPSGGVGNLHGGFGVDSLFSPTATKREWLPKLATRIRVDPSAMTSSRYWVALTESSLRITSPTTSAAANTTEYVGVGALSGGAFICGSGDGINHSGTSMGVTATAGHYYDIIVDMSVSGQLVCSISDNGGPFTTVVRTSNLPIAGTSLGIQQISVGIAIATIRSISIAYTYLESQ